MNGNDIIHQTNNDLNSSLASSLRGSQISSIYHSMDNDESTHGKSISGPTSEATTIQLNRTFINYNDTLSQSNPSSNTVTLNANRKPNNLSLNDSRLKKIYSVTGENLFGLAPLASPESLSEMSSIGSDCCTPEDKHLLSGFESQMHTPKILRRAPKISIPLSAVDYKAEEDYEKLGQVFFAKQVPSYEDDVAMDLSKYKIHHFDLFRKHESSKSDNSLDDVSNDITKPTSTNFRMSDSAINRTEIIDVTNTISSSGTYASANSSLTGLTQQIQNHGSSKLVSKLNAFEEEEYFMSRVTPEGVIESHFPVFYDDFESNGKVNNNQRSTYDNGNSITNESLPLLANLNERTVTVTSAANFVRRKKYVYPIGSNAAVHGSPSYKVTSSNNSMSSPRSSKSSQSLNRNESSV